VCTGPFLSGFGYDCPDVSWTFFHFTGNIKTYCDYQIGVCLPDAGSETVSCRMAAVYTLNRSGRYIHKLLQSLVADTTVSVLVSAPLTVNRVSRRKLTVVQVNADMLVLFRLQEFKVISMVVLELTPSELPMESTH
jgi:hypothetical protein